MAFQKAGGRLGRALFLLILVAGCVGAGSAIAQDHPPEPAPNEPPPKQHKADERSNRGYGPGRQLAHQSKEAAGEGQDEMEEFKHSSSVRMISRITRLNLQQSYLASVLLNFAVIAAVIIWAGRKYLPGIFRDRTAAIQKAMQEAQKASEEARRKLADIETRLQKLDVEIGMMRDAAEREGAAEEHRIKAAAEEDAKKIVVQAEQEIAAAAKAARRQLTAHAADLAVGLAQKQIRVDAATDQALVRNFAAEFGSASGNSGKDGD